MKKIMLPLFIALIGFVSAVREFYDEAESMERKAIEYGKEE